MATDGRDGAWQAGGAMADGGTLQRAVAGGADVEKAKERSDTAAVFEAAGGRIDAFASRTNVMDLYVGLVGAPRR
jgi:glycerate-2-kinase